ncbi:hypothetical protein LCGC14_2774440 [marine sediment metagenome]|uniref:Uncharacterized protein n=1 Tax=marine sediment metagenome TaxID=412755 RepID=A0A0F8YV38_9ZZZZ
MPMPLGATSAKRCTGCLVVKMSAPSVGIQSGQTMSARRSDVRSVGRGIGLVRSAVLLMILFLPMEAYATDWSKFLPPVRSGLGPVELGCIVRGPGLQSTGRWVPGGYRRGANGLRQPILRPQMRQCWDVHFWATYLVHETTLGGIRAVYVKRTWERWYSRRWKEKRAYKDCRRFGKAWKKHLRKSQE